MFSISDFWDITVDGNPLNSLDLSVTISDQPVGQGNGTTMIATSDAKNGCSDWSGSDRRWVFAIACSVQSVETRKAPIGEEERRTSGLASQPSLGFSDSKLFVDKASTMWSKLIPSPNNL